MKRTPASTRRIFGAIARRAGGGPRPMAEQVQLVVDRGRGSYLYERNGSRYLDLVTGHGVASLGHSHPRWVEAVTEQARRLAVCPLNTEELARYLTALTAVLPRRLDQAVLCSTGAEAVEIAIRLGQTASGRPAVLTFKDGFHGKTAAVRYTPDLDTPEASELAPLWLRSAPFPACEHHDAVSYPKCGESAADELTALGRREDLDDVGVVVVEPVLGTAGCIPPRRKFLSELRQLCDERGWLLVFDESITGFGRTGALFAFEWFGVEPDVLVLSKGLGGGFPLSAVCAAASLWDSSALARPSATSSSYGANPLACAAGLATLEIVTGHGFLQRVRAVAARAAARLVALSEASARVARPRGLGLMLGFDLVDPVGGGYAGPRACRAVLRACRDRGMLLPAHVPRVRLTPPLTLDLEEADSLFDVLDEVLA